MVHNKLLGFTTIAAVILTSACDGSSSPTAPSTSGTISSTASGASPSFSKASSRRGVLHATKECSEYNGLPGDFCTITSSNLKEIEVGSKVIYAKGFAGGKLDSDLFLKPPGRGNSVAYGHVILDLTTTIPHGLVTFSGGTGKFKHFHATIDVTALDPLNPDFVNWKWDGPYRFSNNDDDSDEGGDQH